MHALQLGNGETEIGSVYDIASQTFTPFHFSTNAFCAGHSVAEDGTVIIAGKQPFACSAFHVSHMHSQHCTQTQHDTDRLDSWAVSPRPARQGLQLETTESH